VRRWIWLEYLLLPLVAETQHQSITRHRCQQSAEKIQHGRRNGQFNISEFTHAIFQA
jgi:hypothetical protein